MPTPRLDDANIEFSFSEHEALLAQVLDPLKIPWLQTKYAMYWKMKNSTPVPESSDLDRSYFVKIAELEGRLNMIQELLDDHKSAGDKLKNQTQVDLADANKSETATAERAAQLVHRIPIN